MINQNNLAKNLISIMKSRGITTNKLSQDTGIAEITINKIRNGQNQNPTIGTLLPIIKYFNISLDCLFLNEHNNTDTKTGIQIINMDGSLSGEFLDLNQHFKNIDFVLKIDCSNYVEYKKNTLLLIHNQKIANEDIVVIKLNDYLTPCKAIVECGTLIYKSLIFIDKFYQVNTEDILGVVVGAIWKKN